MITSDMARGREALGTDHNPTAFTGACVTRGWWVGVSVVMGGDRWVGVVVGGG